MDEQEFRERGYEMVDYLGKYLESLSERLVTPDVIPGYLIKSLPALPPKTGETVGKIMDDFEQLILPGLIHWQHRGFLLISLLVRLFHLLSQKCCPM